jgi:hypothetical protein
MPRTCWKPPASGKSQACSQEENRCEKTGNMPHFHLHSRVKASAKIRNSWQIISFSEKNAKFVPLFLGSLCKIIKKR